MPTIRECDLPDPAQAISAVRALNQAYIDAARGNDVAWFRRHLAEDVVVVLGGGRRVRKPDFLALMTAEPKRFESLTVRDVTLAHSVRRSRWTPTPVETRRRHYRCVALHRYLRLAGLRWQ